MRLSGLKLEGFGRFAGGFECEFPADIALIVGDNETGKSTLVAAVGAILFGFSGESEKALFAQAPGQGPAPGVLRVESDGKTYRFTRDFGSNRTRVELLGEGGSVLFDGVARPAGRGDEKERYCNLLNTLFGMENRELFYSSIFIEQGKLPAKMEGILRRIVSGSANADYAVVLKTLKESCEQLTVEVRWGRSASRKPRQIEQLDQTLREKKSVLQESQASAASVGQLRERLQALEEKVEATEKAAGEKTEWQQKLNAFSAAVDRKRQCEANLSRSRKEKDEIGELERDIEKLEGEIHENFQQYVDLPSDAEKDLSGLLAQRHSIDELRERRLQKEQTAPRFHLPKWAVGAIAVGVAIVVLSILFFDGAAAFLCGLVGVAAAASPFISVGARLHAEQAAHQGTLGEIDDQLNGLARQQQEMRARYPLLAANGADGVLQRLKTLKRLQADKEKKEEARKQHPDKEQVEDEFNSLSNELISLDHELAVLKEERPGFRDLERENRVGHLLEETKTELEKIQTSLRQLVREKDDARYQLAGAEAREVVCETELEEEIEEKQAQLERLKLYRDAYLQAVETLEEAIGEFRFSHLARIEEKTGEYLSSITGRSCKVCLDKELNPLHIFEDGQKFQPEQLSRGAQDQLFFSLRLAAIGEICNEVSVPIVLDDPFVNFDEGRLAATQSMLEALSKTHQVILLTHDSRYGEWREPSVLLS